MTKIFGNCRLCDAEKVLCKSHIIPKAIFRDAMSDDLNRGLNMYTEQRVETGKMAGEYEYLLCRDCEEIVGRYDDYGIKFLRRSVGERLTMLNGETIPDDIDLLSEVDLEKLRLFIISVLWRASVSSREFYSNVELGPHEIIAKRIIKKELVLTKDSFPFFISRYSGPSVAGKVIINPVPTRINGLLFYNLNMKGFNVAVKVDQRNLLYPFFQIWETLTGMGIVLVYERNFTGSREYEAIRRLLHAASARR